MIMFGSCLIIWLCSWGVWRSLQLIVLFYINSFDCFVLFVDVVWCSLCFDGIEWLVLCMLLLCFCLVWV